MDRVEEVAVVKGAASEGQVNVQTRRVNNSEDRADSRQERRYNSENAHTNGSAFTSRRALYRAGNRADNSRG